MWSGVVRCIFLRREVPCLRALAGYLAIGTLSWLPMLASAYAQDAPSAVLDAPAMLGGNKAVALAGDNSRTRFVIGLEKTVDFRAYHFVRDHDLFAFFQLVEAQRGLVIGVL